MPSRFDSDSDSDSDPAPVPDSTYTRRGLLRRGTVGGLLVGGAAATYGAARFAAKAGEVVVRHVAAIEERADGQRHAVALFHRELDAGGLDDPWIDEALRGRLEGGSGPDDPYRVPDGLHRELAERYEDLTYHVGHRCPNARCSTPQVGRGAFNDLSLGERTRLLYVSARAYRVP